MGILPRHNLAFPYLALDNTQRHRQMEDTDPKLPKTHTKNRRITASAPIKLDATPQLRTKEHLLCQGCFKPISEGFYQKRLCAAVPTFGKQALIGPCELYRCHLWCSCCKLVHLTQHTVRKSQDQSCSLNPKP